MRKIVYRIFIIAALFVCSMSLTSCKAITAQNITNMGSGQGMNGGGINGGPSMDGNRMSNADIIGKIVSLDGNTIKIEVAKQNSNGSSNGNSKRSNNNSDNRKPPQGGFSGGKLELSYTGETKTITVNSDVKISEKTGMPDQNGNGSSKSSTKVSDLKKGQVIMIWYKQNTKIVERISVTQS
ncbi:hypothetical protein [Clostridium drakei]|uniref:DUF5666 domain-containing protein n=1 Tax=Clostridium drakei TaxID=332101 RepID=A0A2U8DTQ2_9CLOT|nr:hypothetical protein [Clostridium drakei]AWI05841.1 hypothetical protein B9W14_15490 [Clostridium drakei]